MNKQQRRKIQEIAYGTYDRNRLIRHLYAQGAIQAELVKAFILKKQRIWQIVHND